MEINQEIFSLWSNNILLSFAALLAIIVWGKTRESSWIFIIFSVLILYIAAIYETLLFFGIFIATPVVLFNLDVIALLFKYIPILLMIIALLIRSIKNTQR